MTILFITNCMHFQCALIFVELDHDSIVTVPLMIDLQHFALSQVFKANV